MTKTTFSLEEGQPKCKKVKNFCHCRILAPSKFDPKSFRTVRPKKGVLITVGCPKGKFNRRTKKCRVGTKAQRIMYANSYLKAHKRTCARAVK